jgi:hypothetical protein
MFGFELAADQVGDVDEWIFRVEPITAQRSIAARPSSAGT